MRHHYPYPIIPDVVPRQIRPADEREYRLRNKRCWLSWAEARLTA
jgi:hypothetical protein